MTLGFIGTGEMGCNLVLKLSKRNHRIVVSDTSTEPLYELHSKGVDVAFSYDELFLNLKTPRAFFIVVPPDKVDGIIKDIRAFLQKGDILIDGSSSAYEDTVRRFGELSKIGVSLIDVGVCGGPGYISEGAAFMVGGDKKYVDKVEKIFKDLSAGGSYAYVGESGAGHLAKAVHDKILLGMIDSLSEGMQVLRKSRYDYDLSKILEIFLDGSDVSSRVVEGLYEILIDKDGESEKIKQTLIEKFGQDNNK